MNFRIALVFAGLSAPWSFGQGLKTPYVPPYFPPPGVVPLPMPTPLPYAGANGFYGSVRTNGVQLGFGASFPAPAPFAYPLTALNPYAFGYSPVIVSNVLPAPTLIAPAPPVPLPNLAPNTSLNRDLSEAEFTAKLDLVFPSPAEVTFDGRKVEGSDAAEVTLTSPPLKVGASHTFNVRAVWSVEGKKYQVERAVAVKAGERSRLTIVTGDPVK